MKKLIFAAVLAALPVSVAQAQLTDTNSPDCAFSGIGTYNWGTNVSYVSCFGSVSGNNEGNSTPGATATINQINTLWGTYGTWSSLGTTDEGETDGPFSRVPGDENGYLTLDSGMSGYFVIGLKASNRFSLYLLNATQPVTRVNFKTDGVGYDKDLSHATLYRPNAQQVPEPASAVLVVSGLAGLAAVVRRRKQA